MTTGELFDAPFWIQVGLLSVLTLLFGLPPWVGIPVAFLLTFLTRTLSAGFATQVISRLHSARTVAHQHEFSIQESMVARGRFDDAVESFRAHLAEHPDDVPARYRLATLHLRERKDPAAAEEEFLALRRRPLDRSTAQLVSNHLIDLYRTTDQRGRLMAELTRMMKEQAGTPLADGAAKLLQELKRGG